MALTPAQQATLKTSIQADPAFNSLPQNSDGAYAIAEAYKLPATPNWTVWKSNVTINEVGKKFNGAELAGLTTGNQTRLQTIAQYMAGGVNPSLLDNRQFFDDVFSGAGGTNTRAALLILWKRLANRSEKLFSTGTGSDAAPATMTVEGTLSYSDVQQAMGW